MEAFMNRFFRIQMVCVAVILSGIFFQLISGIATFDQQSQLERVTVVEDAILSAAVQCYAIEGAYPPNIQYLVEAYGLVLDEKRFIYHYEAIASNIKPKISVYRSW
jgi:hypothetical protein